MHMIEMIEITQIIEPCLPITNEAPERTDPTEFNHLVLYHQNTCMREW